MVHFVRLSLLAALLALATGCADNRPKLSAADRAAIHSVTVRKTSYFPKKDSVTYHTFGQNVGGALGMAAGIAAGHAFGQNLGGAGGQIGTELTYMAEEGEREQFCALLRKHNIDAGRMAGDRFEQKLKASGMFPGKGKPDAEFRIACSSMGVAIGNSVTTRMYPQLRVNATLVNAAGKVLWQTTTGVTGAHDSIQPGSLLVWQANPAGLRRSYEICADMVAERLMADLNRALVRSP